ncbi:hypothetical protein [Rhizobium bangladeshense]|uniref:hypothetical protein n=1 Tax=Rhizobium bangladeshense TaxID=1138189 RepID=UPI001C83BDAA|nr:hypothetical protein [Rhizobium bangladeshense]MBX4889821.1 hypothetical protein [Rhizobium bangladeshense]
MSNLHSDRMITAVRKHHYCEQCGRKIEPGSPAHYAFGNYFGDTYSNYTHVECHAAAHAYAELNGCWGEDYPWFQHMDRDIDWTAWLLEHHPIVAERLNIECDDEEAAQ